MIDLSVVTDDQLMERLRGGEATALEMLYDRYSRQCFGLALRILADMSLAEEVVQEVFTKVWSRPASYSSQKAVRKLAPQLIHHRCIDELRRSSRAQVSLDDP
jgi:RNA polymerase sigma-70 factor (ECF subfamily)